MHSVLENFDIELYKHSCNWFAKNIYVSVTQFVFYEPFKNQKYKIIIINPNL